MRLGNYRLAAEELEFLVIDTPYEPSELPPLVSGLFHAGLIERTTDKWLPTLDGLKIQFMWAERTENLPAMIRIEQEIEAYERPRT